MQAPTKRGHFGTSSTNSTFLAITHPSLIYVLRTRTQLPSWLDFQSLTRFATCGKSVYLALQGSAIAVAPQHDTSHHHVPTMGSMSRLRHDRLLHGSLMVASPQQSFGEPEAASQPPQRYWRLESLHVAETRPSIVPEWVRICAPALHELLAAHPIRYLSWSADGEEMYRCLALVPKLTRFKFQFHGDIWTIMSELARNISASQREQLTALRLEQLSAETVNLLKARHPYPKPSSTVLPEGDAAVKGDEESKSHAGQMGVWFPNLHELSVQHPSTDRRLPPFEMVELALLVNVAELRALRLSTFWASHHFVRFVTHEAVPLSTLHTLELGQGVEWWTTNLSRDVAWPGVRRLALACPSPQVPDGQYMTPQMLASKALHALLPLAVAVEELQLKCADFHPTSLTALPALCCLELDQCGFVEESRVGQWGCRLHLPPLHRLHTFKAHHCRHVDFNLDLQPALTHIDLAVFNAESACTLRLPAPTLSVCRLQVVYANVNGERRDHRMFDRMFPSLRTLNLVSWITAIQLPLHHLPRLERLRWRNDLLDIATIDVKTRVKYLECNGDGRITLGADEASEL